MIFSKKSMRPTTKDRMNLVQVQNRVMFRERVKRYHYSCGLANMNMKPAEMPSWALNHLVSMGIRMLGIEQARREAEALAIVGIAPGLVEAIKSKSK